MNRGTWTALGARQVGVDLAVTVSPLSSLLPVGSSGRLLLVAASVLALNAAPAAADDAVPPAPATAEAVSTTPAPVEPAPIAQVPLSANVSDLFAPDVAIGEVRRELESARRNGLRVSYSLSEAATLKADVLIFGDVVDRELKMSALPAAGPGDSLAKATISRSPTGENVVRVPFNVAARRTLRKFYKITVRLRLIATDAAGNESVAYKRVTLTLD